MWQTVADSSKFLKYWLIYPFTRFRHPYLCQFGWSPRGHDAYFPSSYEGVQFLTDKQTYTRYSSFLDEESDIWGHYQYKNCNDIWYEKWCATFLNPLRIGAPKYIKQIKTSPKKFENSFLLLILYGIGSLNFIRQPLKWDLEVENIQDGC